MFRHALALDERRVRFKPSLARRAPPEDQKLGTHPGDMPRNATTVATLENMLEAPLRQRKKGKGQRKYERMFNAQDEDCAEKETDIREVWFAGCHCGACAKFIVIWAHQ